MANALVPVRVLISSPGDVGDERLIAAEVLVQLNQTAARDAGLLLEPFRWEYDSVPDAGYPQELLDEQFGPYGIFLGIMWARFGTKTHVWGSGTEQEFRTAYDQSQRVGRPRIMFYFKNAAVPFPHSVEQVDQLRKVVEFRSELPQIALSGAFQTSDEFRERLHRDLYRVISDRRSFLPPTPGQAVPLDPNLRASLEMERKRCRQLNAEFRIPNILATLLRMKAPSITLSLGSQQTNERRAVESLIEQYEHKISHNETEPWNDEPLDEFPLIRSAMKLAADEGSSRATEAHLWRTFFLEESGSLRRLCELLGDSTFSDLKERSLRPNARQRRPTF